MVPWLPPQVWVGLGLVDPSSPSFIAGSPLELSGGGYVRLPAVFEYIAEGVFAANTETLEWPTATAQWSDIAFAQVWDAATGGNLLTSTQTIGVGSVPQYARVRISAGAFEIYQLPQNLPYGRSGFGTGPYTTNFIVGQIQAVPFGWGTFGNMLYQQYPNTTVPGVPLLLTFAQDALCGNQPGVWTPGPFDLAA
jgi:hypothetical protein